MITDICDAENKDKYYLGSLIVDKISNHFFSVIDGQQRLTTLYLLMAYLDKSLLKQNCLCFEARNESNQVLSALYKSDLYNEEKEFEGDTNFNAEICNGIKIIQSFFRNHKEYVEKTKNQLKSEKIVIIRTQVPKNIDLNHYFEIMNTRGEQLELHEIAKGRILEKIKDKYDAQVGAKIWDACAQMDEYVQMNFSMEVRKKLFGSDDWDFFECKTFDDIVKKFKASDDSDKKNQSKNNKTDEGNKDEILDSQIYYSLEDLLTKKELKTLALLARINEN